jgi:hypothetical protein
MTYQLGYCTNVHAGADLDRTCDNLRQHALAVKQIVYPDTPLGIGLWLSAAAAADLRQGSRVNDLRAWLEAAGLLPFTFNGFPYGDFHQRVVKHRVYQPAWFEPARRDYTLDLIAIQDQLLPSGMEGSISTLPLQWGNPSPTPEQLAASARNLAAVAEALRRLRDRTGRQISVCLEPEPGCALQRSADVVRFFEQYLLAGRDERAIREHLRVCHDICHAAVMFEDQAEAIARYRAAGIGIGKVQVSSAVVVELDALADEDRPRALDQLREFDEQRYLHQTCVRLTEDAVPVFFEDLPPALQSFGGPPQRGQWRVHFHVPIYVERFGFLATSRSDIQACLRALRGCAELHHLEIETYAWTVLPETLRQATLAEGIAAELRWFQSLVTESEGELSRSSSQTARREWSSNST